MESRENRKVKNSSKLEPLDAYVRLVERSLLC